MVVPCTTRKSVCPSSALNPSFGVRTLHHSEAAEVPSIDILPNTLCYTPPWTLKIPLSSVFYVFQTLSTEIRHTYRDHHHIYTDVSKDQAKVSAAMYTPPFVDSTRLPNNSFCRVTTLINLQISVFLQILFFLVTHLF